jgi:NADPH:quinone reductase-like Zn-dependent oxidoreductase
MKGVIYTKIGGLDVLKIREIEKPVPNDNQVLVSVKAVGLNIIDYNRFNTLTDKVPLNTRFMNTIQGAVGKPLGGEVSGIIAEVGKNIKNVKIGDEVYGKTLGAFPKGGLAEYAILEQVNLKPSNFSFEEAAVMPISGETALGAVRKAKIKQGQQVMIYGASGGVGQYAVQFAKAAGAIVTGVCSTRNIEMARSIGCDYVIDYKQEDFTKVGKTFDAIIGINGCNPLNKYKKLLNANGIFVGVGNGKQAAKAMTASLFSRKITAYAVPLMPAKDYLSYIKKLAEAEKIRPFIDNVYSMQEVAEAIRYIITEHPQGKIVIRVQ